MQFYGIDLLDLISYLGVTGVAVTFSVLFYLLYYKPKIEQPLPNEQSLGYWTISLPRGLGVQSGMVTTALNTLEKLLTNIIENETVDVTKQKIIDTRNLFHECYPIAQKIGRETYIYLFDENPQDPKYLDIDPDRNNSYIVARGVQDAISVGDYKGWKVISVKLNPKTIEFTLDERKQMEARLEIAKYIRGAAKNIEKIHGLKEERDYYQEDRDRERSAKAKERSLKDRALSGLSIVPLTVPSDVKVPGVWRSKVKEWFNWPQVLTAALAYMLAPHIQSWLNLSLTPTTTTYFAALVTVVGFFIIPFGKKLFGRWL